MTELAASPASVDEIVEATRPSRRRVLVTGGVVAAAAAVTAACGSSSGGSAGSAAATSNPAGASSPAGGSTAAASSPAAGVTVATSAVPVGGGTILADQKIVVTQPTAGSYKAFTAVCTHQGCTVASVANGTITCPCHGSTFSAADGSVQAGPAPAPLASIPVTVSGTTITVQA
ncbi:MAG TPA: Rieske (2Fe-2S) protein [Candidatus Nanopelagicales bacterium]